jgi:hypothetical protein
MRAQGISMKIMGWAAFAMALVLLLALALAVPSVQATSIAETAQVTTDDDDADHPPMSALSRDDIAFLESNWHLDIGVLMIEDEASGNPALSRDDVRFLEDNWYLTAEDVFGNSGSDDNPSAGTESDLWLLEEPRMQLHHE